MARTPRRPLRPRQSPMRGVALALCLLPTFPAAAVACRMPPLGQPDVVQGSVVRSDAATAWYSNLTDRYPHGVLGDALEPTTLHLLTDATSSRCGLSVTLDPPYVFEDIAPRLVDLTGDGIPELITVRSHADKGAQLAVYGQVGDKLQLIAATRHIGQRNRWLAPVGAVDLDGDGRIEILYVDRPHLRKTLEVVTFDDGELRPFLRVAGVSNHRIGEDFISGGVVVCPFGPMVVVANAQWSHVMSFRWRGGALSSLQPIPYKSRESFTQALTCS